MNDLRRRFRRRFALMSTLVTVTAAIGVAFLIANTYWHMLMSIGERRHGEIATEFYAAATERFADFLAKARSLAPDAIRDDPETLRLAMLAKSFLRGTRVVRLAIHDQEGRTLFSTAPDEIGSYPNNRRDLQAARRGDQRHAHEHRLVHGRRRLGRGPKARRKLRARARAGRQAGIIVFIEFALSTYPA